MDARQACPRMFLSGNHSGMTGFTLFYGVATHNFQAEPFISVAALFCGQTFLQLHFQEFISVAALFCG
ncbi:hypothetical protein L0128_02340, partial [candidate division KSB1 bacterium]|nr:hypothetical protein [candidate division KSB1 bacterium]